MTPPLESSAHGLVIPRPSGSAFIVQSRRDSSDTLRPRSLAPSTPMTPTSAGPYCLANPDPCLYPYAPSLWIRISGIPEVFTPSHLFSSLTPLCQVHQSFRIITASGLSRSVSVPRNFHIFSIQSSNMANTLKASFVCSLVIPTTQNSGFTFSTSNYVLL